MELACWCWRVVDEGWSRILNVWARVVLSKDSTRCEQARQEGDIIDAKVEKKGSKAYRSSFSDVLPGLLSVEIVLNCPFIL